MQAIIGIIFHFIGGFAAYSFFPKKPSIKMDIEETNPTLIALINQPKLIAA